MTIRIHPARNPYKWRIALTELGLEYGSMANYGPQGERLPAPTVADPRDHSAQVGRGDGGQARHGFRRLELLWERLSENQAKEIMLLIRDAGNGLLYMTIWTGVGYDGSPRWIDVSGYPHWPEQIAPARISGQRGQLYYEPATMLLNNLSVLNDPSSYTD